jgi:YYY domain-containing protein
MFMNLGWIRISWCSWFSPNSNVYVFLARKCCIDPMTNSEATPVQNSSPRRRLRLWIFDILLIYVLLIGAYFRLVGIDWGEYVYLHPDERFLVWVGSDIAPVDDLSDYFDTANSTLNPHNRGHGFYVYGTLPMFITRYVVEWIYGHSGFQEMTDVGRPLSALADLMTVLLVYSIATRVYNKKVGLLASALSALAVLQIQQSHFFTMDTFINFFTQLAIYFAVRVGHEPRAWVSERLLSEGELPDGPGNAQEADQPIQRDPVQDVLRFMRHPFFLLSVAFGIALGGAVASKLNAVPVAVMLPGAFVLQLAKLPAEERRKHAGEAFAYLVLAAFVSLLAFRIFQPYAFSGPGFFGIKPNQQWVDNIVEQRNQATGDVDFPPALQWARRPLTFSLQNLVLWGLGLPFGLLAWGGFLWAGWRIFKGKRNNGVGLNHILLWGWTGFYFAWQSLQFNPTMRYQLPIYPILAIFAGWAIVELHDCIREARARGRLPAASMLLPYLIAGAVLLATFVWAFAFTRIYVRSITRLEASRWIYQNLPGPINLHIQTAEGVYKQPVSFPFGTEIRADQPFVAPFSTKTSGTLQEIYLAHAVNQDQAIRPIELTVLLAEGPNGEGVLATSRQTVLPSQSGSVGSTQYRLSFDPPVLLSQERAYYLLVTISAEGKVLEICDPLMLSIQGAGGPIEQTLPAPPQCSLQMGVSYVSSFMVQETGVVEEIALSGVVDVTPSSGPTTLRLTVAPTGQDNLMAEATLTADLIAGNSGNGNGYLLILNNPVQVEEGQTYQLAITLESGDHPVTLTGTALANEGDWDDGLPMRVEGFDGFNGIYVPGLNFNMYWEENQEKLERFLGIYEQAEYIAISSSRQWGTLPRLPERFPMSTLHYQHLLGCPEERTIEWCYNIAQPGMFTGDFGFELVQVFQSDPSIADLRINDQFAEEAFTVYDHPKVFIFRKTEDYDPQKVAAVLGSVNFDQVVHVTPKKASPHPETLMLPSDRLEEQRAGGTWSELFNVQALYNRFQPLGVLVWYLSVMLVGLLVYPLVRIALPGLQDRGYPLTRTAGMLILSYLVWMAGSLRVEASRLTISAVLLLMALVGGFLAYRQRDELREELRTRWRYYLVIEGLTLAFFLFFLLVRFGNPDLWHQWKGGEKPMDFSYLNAVLKSTSFPPYDPWYAGGYLNYYYYGFVFSGVLIEWLGIVPSFAYNLVLPTLFSMVAMGAFSIGWNLIRRNGTQDQWEAEQHIPLLRKIRIPLLSGVGAALGMALLGNLGIVRMIMRGYQMLGIPGGLTDETGFLTRVVGTFKGFLEVLSGASLPYSVGNWYWDPSRVIPAPGEVEPITEFPYFTFLYADLHAHMIAIPIALLALAWAISLVLGRARWGSLGTAVMSFLLGGMAIGALRPTNTWDFYPYLALGVVSVAYAFWRYLDVNEQTFRGTLLEGLPTIVKRILLTAGAIAALSFLSLILYQPFANWYGLGYSKLDLWKGTHTPISSYLTHWGLFLFVIVSWMVWETREWMASTPLSSLRKLEPYRPWIQLAAVLLVLWIGGMLYLGVRIAWLVIPLMTWAGVLLLRPAQMDSKRVVLFLTGTGLLMTLMVEVVVLRGDIARMNTVFKFYLQVWALFSVSAGAGLGWLISALRRWEPSWRVAWQVGLAILVAAAGLYTVMGGLAKINDRMTDAAPHTLDGMAYMQYSTYNEAGTEMDLSQDYHAIRWMQENINGSPVIVEANSPNLYRWYTRYTIYTGLPSVLGWEWHQQQQRAVNPASWVNSRLQEINQFYLTEDIHAALDFLRKYEVRYIVLGQLERITYAGPGIEKFPAFNGNYWREVYREGDTVIYEVTLQ